MFNRLLKRQRSM